MVSILTSSWTQGIILPQVFTAALAAIVEVATNYILIYWLDLGVM